MKRLCAYCLRDATCLGAYEGEELPGYACDDCCGHSNEDGHCEPLGPTDEEEAHGG